MPAHPAMRAEGDRPILMSDKSLQLEADLLRCSMLNLE